MAKLGRFDAGARRLAAAILFLVAAAVAMIVFNERAYRAQKIDEVDGAGAHPRRHRHRRAGLRRPQAAQEYVDALEANPEVLAAAVYDARGDSSSAMRARADRAPPRSVEAGPPRSTASG